MNQKLRRIISYFLLSVFFVAAAPKELIHEIVCHHEMASAPATDATTVSKTPFKCIFLTQHFVSFTSTDELKISAADFVSFEKIIQPEKNVFIVDAHTHISLRGPPVA